MKKILSIISLFILLTGMVKAQDGEFKTYEVPNFTGIEAGDLANVIISQGEKQSVKIEKSEEGEASVEVKNEILKITPGSMTNFGNVKIYVVCTNLKYVKVSGVSKVSSEGIIQSNARRC